MLGRKNRVVTCMRVSNVCVFVYAAVSAGCLRVLLLIVVLMCSAGCTVGRSKVTQRQQSAGSLLQQPACVEVIL